MSREIKFRALETFERWGEEPVRVWIYSTNAPGVFWANHEYDALESTGLKDKNGVGVETYEGDIVQRRDGKRGVVIWHQESCGFAIDFGGDQPLGSLSSWFEVIGNIYEHHELLKAGDARDN